MTENLAKPSPKNEKGQLPVDVRRSKTSLLKFPIIAEVERVLGCYLGFIVWERSPEWPKAMSFLAGSGGLPPVPVIF